LWRDQLRDWDEQFKPASIATHRELQAVDPSALSDEELVAYLTRCREHHGEMIYQHMRHTGAAVVAIGDFLAHVGDWTGLPPADLLDLMRGAAPVSAGASAELDKLRSALAGDPAARELFASQDEPGRVLGSLRALGGEAGAAAAAYLDLVGYRLVNGFDISQPYALELPDVLLRAIRAAVTGIELDSGNLEARIAGVRGVFSDIWAAGIVRRAVLAAGRRLADAGRIHAAEHLVDAGFDEMCALVSGDDGPSADELAARFAERTSRTAKDAPPLLGPPSPPPPDMSGLPPGA